MCRGSRRGNQFDFSEWSQGGLLSRDCYCFDLESVSQSSLLHLFKSLTASQSQEEATLPLATPQKKTHTRPKRGIYNTHSRVFTQPKLFLLVQWPGYCLFLFEGWVTSTPFLNKPQVREHIINSPTPSPLMTHWTLLHSSAIHWRGKDKGELSPTAKKTSWHCHFQPCGI